MPAQRAVENLGYVSDYQWQTLARYAAPLAASVSGEVNPRCCTQCETRAEPHHAGYSEFFTILSLSNRSDMFLAMITQCISCRIRPDVSVPEDEARWYSKGDCTNCAARNEACSLRADRDGVVPSSSQESTRPASSQQSDVAHIMSRSQSIRYPNINYNDPEECARFAAAALEMRDRIMRGQGPPGQTGPVRGHPSTITTETSQSPIPPGRRTAPGVVVRSSQTPPQQASPGPGYGQPGARPPPGFVPQPYTPRDRGGSAVVRGGGGSGGSQGARSGGSGSSEWTGFGDATSPPGRGGAQVSRGGGQSDRGGGQAGRGGGQVSRGGGQVGRGGGQASRGGGQASRGRGSGPSRGRGGA